MRPLQDTQNKFPRSIWGVSSFYKIQLARNNWKIKGIFSGLVTRRHYFLKKYDAKQPNFPSCRNWPIYHIGQLWHDGIAPRVTGATNQPLVSRHQIPWSRWVEGCVGWCGKPDEGWWRGGHGWQRRRIKSWSSNIRRRAPRRKNCWVASRSSLSEAPLLLLHVLQVHLYLRFLRLHLLEHRGSRLLLKPPELLPLEVLGIGLLEGEQAWQRHPFLLC